MPLQLTSIDPLEVNTWNRTIGAEGAHSPFHSTEWAPVLKNSYGYRPHYLPLRGYVSYCVQNRLRKTSGHGKRLITEIDLLTKEHRHDHSSQA